MGCDICDLWWTLHLILHTIYGIRKALMGAVWPLGGQRSPGVRGRQDRRGNQRALECHLRVTGL